MTNVPYVTRAAGNVPDGSISTAELADNSVTAAKIAANEVGASEVGSLPVCRVYKAGAQTIGNTDPSIVTFDSERFDTDTMHSTSLDTGRLTATTGGVYVVSASVIWDANATGIREIWLQLNGSSSTKIADANQLTVGAGGWTIQSVTGIWKFPATHYVELIAYQSSGGSLDLKVDNQGTEFAMAWIGDG